MFLNVLLRLYLIICKLFGSANNRPLLFYANRTFKGVCASCISLIFINHQKAKHLPQKSPKKPDFRAFVSCSKLVKKLLTNQDLGIIIASEENTSKNIIILKYTFIKDDSLSCALFI